jgi:hypothetical protein
MLTREEILSGYKKINFPDKFLEKSTQEKGVKSILFFEESKQPSSKKEKDIKNLSQSYVLPWRYVQKNHPDAATNKNNTFSRGGNFVPKEPLIDIKIDNFKLLYEKYGLPIETALIYIKNNYGGAVGPYNFEQIQNMYKNKKFDSNNEFRTIDIFCFKNSEIFTFQSLKIINDEKWIDLVIDSPLLKYNELFKEKEEEKKGIESKKEEKTKEQEKKKEEVKKEEPKKEEEKKEDKKEEKPNDNKPKETEGKWEVVGKKKSKNIKEKLDDVSNEIIGLKKEGKKGKKKKKGQFEDTNFELGFQIK